MSVPPAHPSHRTNQAPLRQVTGREVLADRVRYYLECGHALERRPGGFAHRARCVDCLREGRS